MVLFAVIIRQHAARISRRVAAVCYPFLLILGAYFLWRFLSSAATAGYSTAIVTTVLLAYVCIRMVGAWPDLLSDRKYGVLETPAGTVRAT